MKENTAGSSRPESDLTQGELEEVSSAYYTLRQLPALRRINPRAFDAVEAGLAALLESGQRPSMDGHPASSERLRLVR